MPQLSKKPLPYEVKEKILNTLFDSIINIGRRNVVKEFIDNLLTPTEKIMLAKRLAAAYFLEKGCTYKFISKILKLSPTTINTIQRELIKGGGGYKAVFRLISNTSKLEELMEKLDRIVKTNNI